jgi:hypothetical protein
MAKSEAERAAETAAIVEKQAKQEAARTAYGQTRWRDEQRARYVRQENPRR